MIDLGNDRFRAIMYKARKYASIQGYDSDADDFAQFAAERISSGRKASIGLLFIDWKRMEFGVPNENVEANALRKAEKRTYTQLDDNSTGTLGTPEYSTFALCKQSLPSGDRAILALVYEWGLTLNEIADVFGQTEGRVCQRLKDIKQRLKPKLASQA